MDERLHRLMYAVHRAVNGVLLETLVALQEEQVAHGVVLDGRIVQVLEVHAREALNVLHLFYIAAAHIRREVLSACP